MISDDGACSVTMIAMLMHSCAIVVLKIIANTKASMTISAKPVPICLISLVVHVMEIHHFACFLENWNWIKILDILEIPGEKI